MNQRRYGKKAAVEENTPVTEPVQETPVAAVEEAVEVKPAKAEEPKKNNVVPTRSRTMVLCNLRKTPRIESSNILCAVPKGADIIKYVGEDHGDFFRVKYTTFEGFIKKELCE